MSIRAEDHHVTQDLKRTESTRQQQQQAAQEADKHKAASASPTQSSQSTSHASTQHHKVDEAGLDKLKQDEQWKNFSHTRAPVQAPSIAVAQHGVAPVEEAHKTSAAQMLRDVTQGVKV